MTQTTDIRGSIYGIGVIEHDADFDQIVDALVEKGIEVDSDSTLNNVYVSPENVAEAAKVINNLGYTTDEDDEE